MSRLHHGQPVQAGLRGAAGPARPPGHRDRRRQLPDRPVRAGRGGRPVRGRAADDPHRPGRGDQPGRAGRRGRAGHRAGQPVACRLPERRAGRHGGPHRAGARRGRAGALGPVPLGRRGPGRTGRQRRRPGRGLHVQVPERGPGRARVPVRAAGPAGPAAPADPGLVRPAGAVRDGPGLRSAAHHGPVHHRDAEHPGHGGRAGGRPAARRGRYPGPAGQGHPADQLPDRAGRQLAGPARLRAGHAAGSAAPRLARLAAPPRGVADQPGADPGRGHRRLPGPGPAPARPGPDLHPVHRRLGRADHPPRNHRDPGLRRPAPPNPPKSPEPVSAGSQLQPQLRRHHIHPELAAQRRTSRPRSRGNRLRVN